MNITKDKLESMLNYNITIICRDLTIYHMAEVPSSLWGGGEMPRQVWYDLWEVIGHNNRRVISLVSIDNYTLAMEKKDSRKATREEYEAFAASEAFKSKFNLYRYWTADNSLSEVEWRRDAMNRDGKNTHISIEWAALARNAGGIFWRGSLVCDKREEAERFAKMTGDCEIAKRGILRYSDGSKIQASEWEVVGYAPETERLAAIRQMY